MLMYLEPEDDDDDFYDAIDDNDGKSVGPENTLHRLVTP